MRTLFDAQTVSSLVGEGSDFLRICEPGGGCLVQRRFFSLILASAQLVGSPFAAGSYLSINVGVCALRELDRVCDSQQRGPLLAAE